MIRITVLLIIACILSVVAVNWIFLKVLRVAILKGLVDNPDVRKLQKMPVPVLGGIAVFFGLLFGLLSFEALNNIWLMANDLSTTEGSQIISHTNALMDIGPVLVGAGIMLYVGALDDIIGLTPRARLLIEILVMLGVIYGSGMCVDSFHGLWGVGSFSWWLAVPLTVFAGVGIINAYNMVDGVNGLSSGLCIVCSVLLGTIFTMRDDMINAALSLCFAGALLPFYVHNVFGKKSKMFIGDAGTMVMGLLMSWFLIRVLSSQNVEMDAHASDNNQCLVAMMLAIASVPVFDTLRVMTARIIRGVNPFSPDKTHLHHVFIHVGVSHWITSNSELMINLIVVGVWYASYRAGCSLDCQLYAVIVAAVVLVWGSYLFLYHQYKYNTKAFAKFNRWSRMTHLGHTQWWMTIQKWMDKGV